jgi:hypothetical protein
MNVSLFPQSPVQSKIPKQRATSSKLSAAAERWYLRAKLRPKASNHSIALARSESLLDILLAIVFAHTLSGEHAVNYFSLSLSRSAKQQNGALFLISSALQMYINSPFLCCQMCASVYRNRNALIASLPAFIHTSA